MTILTNDHYSADAGTELDGSLRTLFVLKVMRYTLIGVLEGKPEATNWSVRPFTL